jgi:lipopolysaccharide/colanic/teichoic acid biosynthesis glycosyltransferase
MKRLFDILFAGVAFVIFIIPVTFIIVAIKVFENHPILFYQIRVGRNKKVFKIMKFQTMVDMKVTKTGRILRKTGLDELPQFLNVLKGDMSIVGPRAITEDDVERFGWSTQYHKIRWRLKPGITGYAQIYGGQSLKTSWFWDKKYISTPNLAKDLGVICLSFLMNIFGKTRVRRMDLAR